MHWIAPAAILAVVALMIVPMPPLLLDLLLSIDIGLSVVLLLTAIYVKEPVEFSVFPSLLLVLTLLRLSLNVAGTRLILLHGADGVDAAGHVIMAFGQFVVGGNFVVGIVVFLVLIAIQFVVINHGAVRISEVTARFTLDALPGKQMAIDADLNAGLIDERQARERRDKIRREADFYGAMDGAIRFTQRDAMAAILITGVNIVAGLIIGVLQHGMPLADAAADVHHPDGRRGPGHGDPGAARVDVGRPDHHARRVGVAPRRGSRDAAPDAGAAAGRRRRRAAARWPRSRACRSSPSSPSAACWACAAWVNRDAMTAAPVDDAAPARAGVATRRTSPRSIRSASRSATRSSRWSTRSRAARCCRASARSASRSPPTAASSCRRCTSPTTCSSGRGPTRSSSRASKWRAAS